MDFPLYIMSGIEGVRMIVRFFEDSIDCCIVGAGATRNTRCPRFAINRAMASEDVETPAINGRYVSVINRMFIVYIYYMAFTYSCDPPLNILYMPLAFVWLQMKKILLSHRWLGLLDILYFGIVLMIERRVVFAEVLISRLFV